MAGRDAADDGPEGANGPAAGWRRAVHSVRVQMALLTVALVLTTGLAAALVILDGYHAHRRSTVLQLTETATALSLAVDGKVRESAGVVTTLALSNDLAIGDLRAFDLEARQAVAGSDRWVVLVDDQGRRLIDTARPPGARLPPMPPTFFHAYRRDAAGQEIYVSNLFSNSLTGRLGVGVAVPVQRAGRPAWRLAIRLDPGVLQQIFAEQGLPPGWIGTLHDRQGRVIARSFNGARYLGRLGDPDVLEHILHNSKGVFEGRSWEGVPILTVYKRSPLTGWTLRVAMPKAAAKVALFHSLALTLALVLGLLLLGVALVWWFGGRVAGAIGCLAQAAQALGRGAPIAPTATGLSEIDAVGWALYETSIRLKQREDKIRRLVDSDIIGITVWTLGGKVVDANDAFLALVGYDREDLLSGRLRWADLTPGEWREANARAEAQIRTTGSFQPFEKEFFRKDGSRAPVLVGGAAFSGTTEEGVAFVLDLSERKQAEARQKVMVDELNHRVKNTLATVMAISAQTLRTTPSPEAFREAFQGRLKALSKTHDLLNQTCWTGVSLRDLVEQASAPHGQDGRFLLVGEDVRLGPIAAVTLGLALHELTANAARYGALSTPAGHVRVAWRPSAPGRLQLVWEEFGGPPVQPPSRRGFGSEMIQKVLAAELRGEVRLEFPPQGLRCTMDMVLDQVSAH